MIQIERDEWVRRYAAGDVTWRALRDEGFQDYIEVLAALSELELRAPVAPMEGPNVAARQRGRSIIREHLRDRG